MQTHADNEAPFVIDAASILPQLQRIMRTIDDNFGAGYARQHPNLVAACLLRQLADEIASAIRDARIGE